MSSVLTKSVALVLIVAAACGSADTGTAVTIHNATDGTVRAREVGINSGSDIVTALAPSADRKSLWRFGTGSTITLKADDATGALIFCHAYTFAEVQQLKGEVSVVKGRLDCK